MTSAWAATPEAAGTVGPGYTISLKKAGKKVTTLKAGKYTFVINDKASIHSFSLDGPNGLEKTLTTVPFKGTKTRHADAQEGLVQVLLRGRTRARCSGTSRSP